MGRQGGRAVRLALSRWYLIGTLTGLRRSVGRDQHLPGKARRARVNLFLGVAGLGWVSTKRSGGPGSISGCKALQGVAEGCFGGCWYPGIKNNRTDVLPPWTLGRCRCRDGIGALWWLEGDWRESGSGTPLHGIELTCLRVCRVPSGTQLSAIARVASNSARN